MSLHQEHKDDLEARVTAWLLGELSPAEEATLREQFLKSPELLRQAEELAPLVSKLQQLGEIERIDQTVWQKPSKRTSSKQTPSRQEIWTAIGVVGVIVVSLYFLMSMSLSTRGRYKAMMRRDVPSFEVSLDEESKDVEETEVASTDLTASKQTSALAPPKPASPSYGRAIARSATPTLTEREHRRSRAISQPAAPESTPLFLGTPPPHTAAPRLQVQTAPSVAKKVRERAREPSVQKADRLAPMPRLKTLAEGAELKEYRYSLKEQKKRITKGASSSCLETSSGSHRRIQEQAAQKPTRLSRGAVTASAGQITKESAAVEPQQELQAGVPVTSPKRKLPSPKGEKLGLAEAFAGSASKKKSPIQKMKAPRPPGAVPMVFPEVDAQAEPFSTFSLYVTDVSYRLAKAALSRGSWPPPEQIRPEEFLNAFDYGDRIPPGKRVALKWELGPHPFEPMHYALRFAVITAGTGRQRNRPANLVLVIDRSGSMERPDRIQIVKAALRELSARLMPNDRVSVVTFSVHARLRMDGARGDHAAGRLMQIADEPCEGATNLGEALQLAYELARKHFVAGGHNRIVLLTDGAVNVGELDAEQLAEWIEQNRRAGIALDVFGVGWGGYNDLFLQRLAKNGDGLYRFLNSPDDVQSHFAEALVGMFHPAATDVKVQVEFNPETIARYRLIGYATHRLTKEQFRDDTVDAGELAAGTSGNALYTFVLKVAHPTSPLAWIRIRYRVPETEKVIEETYEIPPTVLNVEPELTPSLRLAIAATAFAEWMMGSPYASEVTPHKLLDLLKGVPEYFEPDPRPRELVQLIETAGRLAGWNAGPRR